MAKLSFKEDPRGFVYLGFRVRFEKLYTKKNDIILNTIYTDYIAKNDNKLWNDFVKYMNINKLNIIDLETLDNFVNQKVNGWYKTIYNDYAIDYYTKFYPSFIFDKITHKFYKVELGEHQNIINKIINETFKQGFTVNEMDSVIDYLTETLIIKGSYWNVDNLIKDSVRYHRKRVI